MTGNAEGHLLVRADTLVGYAPVEITIRFASQQPQVFLTYQQRATFITSHMKVSSQRSLLGDEIGKETNGAIQGEHVCARSIHNVT